MTLLERVNLFLYTFRFQLELQWRSEELRMVVAHWLDEVINDPCLVVTRLEISIAIPHGNWWFYASSSSTLVVVVVVVLFSATAIDRQKHCRLALSRRRDTFYKYILNYTLYIWAPHKMTTTTMMARLVCASSRKWQGAVYDVVAVATAHHLLF